MKKYHLILILATSFFVRCSDSGLPTENQLDSSINGKTVLFARNQKFSLELDLHADGGYQWDCQISDTTIARMDGSPSYRPKNPGVLVGGMTVETVYYRTINTGRCTITLVEHRVWEKDVPPINTVLFGVLVE